ncbi:endonuclease/exonuclease/phosphatase family protein [Streptomyces sp. NPDC050560]|uniref:endonuclease/exonuclease/phosphatase family protein n=1 Tax=Streptomyces sp. NPDC050560 TaxID=3365630 RepID=UPI0037A082B1
MRASLAGAAALVALTLAGALAAPAGAEDTASAPPGAAATSLRVLDWNIEGGNSSDGDANWDAVESTIRAESPDVVTLQEVHNDSGHDVDGSPGINQWQRLLDDFPEYEGHFARGDVDDQGGSAGELILTRAAIAEKVSYILPNDDSGAVDHSMGGVRIRVGGSDVRVYTAHLSAGEGAAPTARRTAQTGFIADKLPADLMTTPVLFTGDLNFRPGDPLRPVLAATGLYDAWTEVAANTGADVVTHSGGDDARIDYTYASPGLDVTAAHTVDSGASDHRAVVTDLAVRAAPRAKTGAVLAGAGQRAGWANLAVDAGGAATLRVCDNEADGWGVRAYVTGGTAFQGADGAFADGCGTFTGTGVSASPTVRVCLYKAGTEKDCRERKL